jgi:SpoVK/Ycf46/Vps4 family AAA+-type ATPase
VINKPFDFSNARNQPIASDDRIKAQINPESTHQESHEFEIAASNRNSGAASPRDKEGITIRGQLELLENVLVDVISELKYHR